MNYKQMNLDQLEIERLNVREKRTSNGLFGSKDCQVMRSMISPEYANRFIREYILKGE